MRRVVLLLFLLTPVVARGLRHGDRRLLAGVPKAINIPKACEQDSTCNHGNCRNGTCLCTPGYSTIHPDDLPCTTKGRSQLLVLLVGWFFNFLGAGAFILGWWWFGVAILVAMLFTICCGFYSGVKTDEGEEDEWRAQLSTCCTGVCCCSSACNF